MTDQSADLHGEFLKLFVPMELSLRRFVAVHIPGYHQGEDVFQEIALVLWKQFDRYDTARPFAPWAFGIAWNVVLKSRRTAGRDRHVFQEDVAERISARLEARSEELDARHQFLEDCMGSLSEENLALLRMKYTERRRVNAIAAALGRTPNAVRLVLFRIRVAINKCLEAAAKTSGEVAT